MALALEFCLYPTSYLNMYVFVPRKKNTPPMNLSMVIHTSVGVSFRHFICCAKMLVPGYSWYQNTASTSFTQQNHINSLPSCRKLENSQFHSQKSKRRFTDLGGKLFFLRNASKITPQIYHPSKLLKTGRTNNLYSLSLDQRRLNGQYLKVFNFQKIFPLKIRT